MQVYDEAVELVNSNNYANGVALFTRDGRTAREFQMDIEVGMVGINVSIPVPIGAFSFGGWKASLFGDTHMYRPESFNFYTHSRVITSRWPLPDESQIELGFSSDSGNWHVLALTPIPLTTGDASPSVGPPQPMGVHSSTWIQELFNQQPLLKLHGATSAPQAKCNIHLNL